jgi:PIN domain nuclease of toxin-antitoxin system
MAVYVPDTHCLIWQATAAPQLGVQALAILTQVDQGNAQLIIPAIVVAELIFTIERRKLPLDFDLLLQRWRANPAIEIVPLTLDRLLLMRTVTTIPEMHDRLIACEAKLRNATLITRNRSIVAARFVPTIW